MEILVLASGSSGNAALVSSGSTSLLVDAGISALAVRRRLGVFGRSENQISAVLLTHEHSDHVRGLEVLQKRRPTPVWTTAGTWQGIRQSSSDGGELRSGSEVHIGELRVLPVATSHDAREPVALIIDNGRWRVGLCTDTGVVTGLLARRLGDCDVLLVEANHDTDMLRHGPYPWPLKQRIASRVGHLANHQLEEALRQLRSPRLRGLVALHLSEHNNQPQLVRQLVRSVLGAQLPIGVAGRDRMVRVCITGDGATSIEERDAPPAQRRHKAGTAPALEES